MKKIVVLALVLIFAVVSLSAQIYEIRLRAYIPERIENAFMINTQVSIEGNNKTLTYITLS
ncbi:MAG: hypothetical protein WCR02_12650 [Sphaerochaetaceae bacterium]